MSKPIKPWHNRKSDRHDLLCRGLTGLLLGVLLAVLVGLPVSQARADELAPDENATITLENNITMFVSTGNISFRRGGQSRLFLPEGVGDIWSAAGVIPVAAPSHIKMRPASGKFTVAGGVGKSIFAVSAELYDTATQSWLTKGRLNLGRWQHSKVLPFSGRVLVWGGIVLPF